MTVIMTVIEMLAISYGIDDDDDGRYGGDDGDDDGYDCN